MIQVFAELALAGGRRQVPVGGLKTKMMIAAAAFVAVAGMASAETLEANIPFAFRAGGKVLPAGTYRIRAEYGNSGRPILFVSGRERGQQAIAVPFADGYPKMEWAAAGNAMLSFQCGIGRCALGEVWMGSPGTPTYRLTVPKLGRDESRQVAEIVMHAAKAD
jgi:hypothetical protein